MADSNPDLTPDPLRADLAAGFADMRTGFADLKDEMRSGFADLKATLVTRLPTRESSEEMVRLLRESNRLQEERFTQFDMRSREQHLATQHVLHSLVESHQRLSQTNERLAESHHRLTEEHRGLSQDIKALIVRLDAMFRRDNGGPAG
jgi:hypothetical protein